MKSNKKNFRHDSLQDKQSILNILHEVTAGLEAGHLVLSDDYDEITLAPQGLLQLKLTASQEENKYNFALKVSWQLESEETTRKNSPRVSSKPK